MKIFTAFVLIMFTIGASADLRYNKFFWKKDTFRQYSQDLKTASLYSPYVILTADASITEKKFSDSNINEKDKDSIKRLYTNL